mgnify:CR=1 FL=1
MKFIDLFAGLGGFHVGLAHLGYECVFASEINAELAELYEKNFGIKVHSDIRNIKPQAIPKHDILCAGFPCQPFSKAGQQNGLQDQRGSLFDCIVAILKLRKPTYFILENVPNLLKHNQGQTWAGMKQQLEELGYAVDEAILSPHHIGVPQHRLRAFIVGSRKGLQHFSWIDTHNTPKTNITTILEKKPQNARKLGKREQECLQLWQEILDALPPDAALPLPLWTTEFGATYPFEDKIPTLYSPKELSKYKGAFGKSLRAKTLEELLPNLPSYARHNAHRAVQLKNAGQFPSWKRNFIRKSRQFYTTHQQVLEPFLCRLESLHHSWQKFEWNCGTGKRDLSKYLIQFRASGIRVKLPNYAPALVTTSTQIPVIGWQMRYMTAKEGARLQSLDVDSLSLPAQENRAFQALGNAVNAQLVQKITEKLIQR